ncbi:MAG: hypothetical protein LASZOEIN_000153 [Candidatus Fervidibacter sp.]|jgi:hypothetical protein
MHGSQVESRALDKCEKNCYAEKRIWQLANFGARERWEVKGDAFEGGEGSTVERRD